MDIVTQLVQLVSLVVSIMLIVAILRIFTISKRLGKMCEQMKTVMECLESIDKRVIGRLERIDTHICEGFNSMFQASSEGN